MAARKRKKLPMGTGRLTKEYMEWRAAVIKRDKGKCQFPGCKRKAREVHHICRWADAPNLRYTIANGISLCRQCHRYKLKDKELLYVQMFIDIIKNKNE